MPGLTGGGHSSETAGFSCLPSEKVAAGGSGYHSGGRPHLLAEELPAHTSVNAQARQVRKEVVS